jgi:hemoglobin
MTNAITENAKHGDIASKTLYERLGGTYAIATAVDRLIENLHQNETLNNANEQVKAFHAEKFKAGYKFMVTAWVVEVTGGPKIYSGRDMVESHSHLGISAYEFDVTAHEIRNTLYQLAVPRQEIDEFMIVIDAQREKIVADSALHTG